MLLPILLILTFFALQENNMCNHKALVRVHVSYAYVNKNNSPPCNAAASNGLCLFIVAGSNWIIQKMACNSTSSATLKIWAANPNPNILDLQNVAN